MTTWNPADAATGITLSNGNLTSACTIFTIACVRATNSHSAGKWYFEVTLGHNIGGSTYAFGLGSAAQSLTTYVGGSSDAVGARPGSSRIDINGASIGSVTMSIFQTHVHQCAVDIDAKRIWFRADAGTWNSGGDPTSGTGGYDISSLSSFTLFPMWGSNTNTDIATANFGGSAFSQSVPSGFQAWDAASGTVTTRSYMVPGIAYFVDNGQRQMALPVTPRGVSRVGWTYVNATSSTSQQQQTPASNLIVSIVG